MNLYNMLPFLDGWKVHSFTKQETVEKDRYTTVFSKLVKGWLQTLDFYSDDAYGNCKVTYGGEVAVATPNSLFVIGAMLPPPYGGYIMEYIRPSTLSTVGVYAYSAITSAYPMSINGLVRIELGLENDSTQDTATVVVSFLAIEVVDAVAFIRSVRRFLYGWLGWAFGVLSHIPGLKYMGIPDEIKEVIE